MFRSHLAAAFRNMVRHPMYTLINVAGLSIGICAAILMALIIRNQLSYDHFIPHHERTYLAVSVLAPTGRAPDYNAATNNKLAALLKIQSNDVEAVTRLGDDEVLLSSGQTEAKEKIYWADANAFDVLPLPVIAGDLNSALRRPDGIALTRSMARKYFGRDDVIGESLQLNRTHAMVVTAVLRDLPPNATQLESGIFAAAIASFSQTSKLDAERTSGKDFFGISVRTYFRLAEGATIERLQQKASAWGTSLSAPPIYHLEFMKLDEVHLSPGFNPGLTERLTMSAVLGVLILFVATVNFVNLSTAHAVRRAAEVAIRKMVGASRSALIVQFLGESLFLVICATLLAIAMTELLLPYVNAFGHTGAVFDYWRNPVLLLWMTLGVVALSCAAGLYPALALSAFEPAVVLKRFTYSGSIRARHVLVTLQFAAMIGLAIAAGVTYQQHVYATRDALRIDTDQVLIIRSPCRAAFLNKLRDLHGARDAFCSSDSLLSGASFGDYTLKNGSKLTIEVASLDFGLFDLYGINPIASREGAATTNTSSAGASHYVINEAARRAFGFASPAAAIGQALMISDKQMHDSEIVGVLPDFSMDPSRARIRPTMYKIGADDGGLHGLIHVKLTGREIPETLAAIDKLWSVTGGDDPIVRFFLHDYIQDLYSAVMRDAQFFGLFSGVAILLACLGLVGLAAATVERRTKEIGIRKATGARMADVMRLLLWQFTKPVLWANLIAWPIAGFFMNRWLHGFAEHVELRPLLFFAASAAALIIALLTVGAHCYLVARAKPVAALRYE